MLRPNRGFTLIEAMIVLAIIGIIVAIVLPPMLGHEPGQHQVPVQVIDGCEYIQPDYDEWIHKGNCSNPIHNN